MSDYDREIESAISALAETLAKQGIQVTQPTKSKKKRERLRLKKIRKEIAELEEKYPEAKKEVIIEEEERPFPFLEIPPEVRIMVYERLFARPICIVPAVNFYKHRPRHNRVDQGNIKYSVYRYQWAGHPQTLPTYGGDLHSRDGSIETVYVAWTTDDLTPRRS